MDGKIIYHEIGKDPLFKTWHASDEAMIIFVYSEGGSIVCSEKSYPIKKGTLCFVGAGKYHYTMPDITESYDKLLKLLPVESDFHNFADDSFVYAQIGEKEMAEADVVFKEIKKYESDEKYSDLILMSLGLKLLVFLDKYSLESAPKASGFMNKAIEFINANIFENIDIDDICSAVHMSKYYFCRQFKKNTGMTVMKYILRTKIIMAKNMLLKESFSVTEISERCGFSSISYFCRTFKDEIGITPLKYRKSGRGGSVAQTV